MKDVVYFELIDTHEKILTNQKGVILLHDNSRPHAAKLTQQKIGQLGCEVHEHLLWSPDFAPSDYYLFQSLGHHPCNKHYEDFDEVKADFTAFLNCNQLVFVNVELQLLFPARWAKVFGNNGGLYC